MPANKPFSKAKGQQIIRDVTRQPRRSPKTEFNIFKKASVKKVTDKEFQALLTKMTGVFDQESGDEDRVVIIGIHRGRICTHTDRLFYTGSRRYLAMLFCQLYWRYAKEAEAEEERVLKVGNAK